MSLYDLLCKLNDDGKHFDVIAGRRAEEGTLTGGTKQRQRYIVLKMDMLESMAEKLAQMVDGKPRYQIALSTVNGKLSVSKRKIRNRTIDYQPGLETPRRGLVRRGLDKILRREPVVDGPVIFNATDLIDRSKP